MTRSEVGGNKLEEGVDFKQLDTWKHKADYSFNEFSGTFVLLDDQHLNSKVYGMCLHMIDLTRVIMSTPELSGIISYGLAPVTQILTNYLLLTADECSSWHHHFNQYIADDDNEYDMGNLKAAVTQALFTLVELYEDDAVKMMMAVIDTLLFNYQEKDMKSLFVGILKRIPGSLQSIVKAQNIEELFDFKLSDIFGQPESLQWKRREAALLMLGKFSTDIVGNYAAGDKKKVKTLVDSLISILAEPGIDPIRRNNLLSTRKRPLDHRSNHRLSKRRDQRIARHNI